MDLVPLDSPLIAAAVAVCDYHEPCDHPSLQSTRVDSAADRGYGDGVPGGEGIRLVSATLMSTDLDLAHVLTVHERLGDV